MIKSGWFTGVAILLIVGITVCAPAMFNAQARIGQWPGQIQATSYDNRWTNTGSLNDARVKATATRLLNGEVLVAGGQGTNGYLASAELYDPDTGTWSRTGSMHSAHWFHSATRLPNGKVLVAGGLDENNTPITGAELYDPTSGNWSNTGSLHIARFFHTATLLSNGKVLVVGGNGASDYLCSTELYDPDTGIWSITGSLHVCRGNFSATQLITGKVLVAGGATPNYVNETASAELYDPDTGLWTETGSMKVARIWPTATLLPDGKVLVAGSEIYGNTNAITELYDPDTGIWSYTGTMHNPRGGFPAVLLDNDTVLVAGGCCHLSSSELYNPLSGDWSYTSGMHNARKWHTATILSNGKVLVAGGENDSGILATAELYGPTEDELNYLYLPILSTPPGIFGRVTENGWPATGISLELRFFDGATWSTRSTTTTGWDGNYTFTSVPTLEPGQSYYVQYTNTTNSSRLSTWHTRELNSYNTSSSIHIGDFDIANINLGGPDWSTETLPCTFSWDWRMPMPSDNYRVYLYDPQNSNTNFTSPGMGFDRSYTINSLPAGFNNGVQYLWVVRADSPDGGYGVSYWSNHVTFSGNLAEQNKSDSSTGFR